MIFSLFPGLIRQWPVLPQEQKRNSHVPDISGQGGEGALMHPSLVEEFYRRKAVKVFWLQGGVAAAERRERLLAYIDSAAWWGLDSSKYGPDLLRGINSERGGAGYEERNEDGYAGSPDLVRKDRLITDAAISFFRDLYQGDVSGWISYDGVSSVYSAEDDRFVLDKLVEVRTAAEVGRLADSLAPGNQTGRRLCEVLKAELGRVLSGGDSAAGAVTNRSAVVNARRDSVIRAGVNVKAGSVRALGRDERAGSRVAALASSLNMLRWIFHHEAARVIVINIPSAELYYYAGDSLILRMKVVVGQPSKRTPRFAARCSELVLYPYWNVPHKIAVNELLPLFKKRPDLAAFMGMEVLDGQGKVLDAAGLPWATYTARNFPYRIRQVTGCANALGVIKFNVEDPYDVYMHDTNLKSAFSSAYRYYSHGCIRLEKPIELGNELMDHRLDTLSLLSCFKDREPAYVGLEKAVPVFVGYMSAGVDSAGRVVYYRDVYHLLK